MLLKASKNDSFSQDVYIDVNKERQNGKDLNFWEDPSPTRLKMKTAPSKPDKLIVLTINFDC